MTISTMDEILDQLNDARQRATYGAVAGVLGGSPRTLMSGRERNQRHSWIVSLRSGQPTDYPPELLHPDLNLNDGIIRNSDELIAFLASRGVTVLVAQPA